MTDPAARKTTPAASASIHAAKLILPAVALLALLLLSIASPAAAEVSDLTVSMDQMLGQVSDSASVIISGGAVTGLGVDATIQVRIAGPAAFSQLLQSSATLPAVGTFTIAAASLPEAARPSGTQVRLPIPMTTLPVVPGAYRVTVELRSDGALVAAGSTWMGRVATRGRSLDVAFVWRAELGIHKDPEGRFFDGVVQQACALGGGLPGLAGLSKRYPDWRFSLGIEPVLLSQLRDMSDGYKQADGSVEGANVSGDDQTAKDAAAVLTTLAGNAGVKSVVIAAAPYAGPDLGLLGTRDWRDGFAQVQLGKQEVTQTLALGLPPTGAFSPGLDLSGNSVGDYGQASIDHVLVDAAVAESLNEAPAAGAVAVRVHDEDNDRVTLILADHEMRALMAPPWDASVLFAGMAAILASGGREALVLTTQEDYVLPPEAYLDAIGEELKKDSWIRTQTMSDLLESHPPGTRPLLLTRAPVSPGNNIGQTVFSAVEVAHAAVDDLAAGADPASLTLESARRALYLAESRWWTRPGANPQEASVGYAYAVQAETTAKEALGKVGFDGVKDSLIWGRDGDVVLSGKNDTDSAMTVEVRLLGPSLEFPQGDALTVKLKPGGESITVPVIGTSKTADLSVRMIVGSTVLGEQTASLRFVTITDVVLWTGLAVLVIVVIALVTVVFVRGRKKRRPS